MYIFFTWWCSYMYNISRFTKEYTASMSPVTELSCVCKLYTYMYIYVLYMYSIYTTRIFSYKRGSPLPTLSNGIQLSNKYMVYLYMNQAEFNLNYLFNWFWNFSISIFIRSLLNSKYMYIWLIVKYFVH